MELGVGGSNPPCCTKTMSKEKNLKPSKELPLGFVDRQEKELLIRDFVISNIKGVMIKFGFQYLETPSFEYTDSIGKFLPDKERPDEGVFSFKDEKKWLSLRYDLTAPLARYVAKKFFCDIHLIMIMELKFPLQLNAKHHFAHAKLLLS